MKRSEGKLDLLIGTALLSPALRLIPGSAAALGGSSAWLGPLAALPLGLLYAALLRRLRGTLDPGECFPELMRRALGRRPGGALLLLPAYESPGMGLLCMALSLIGAVAGQEWNKRKGAGHGKHNGDGKKRRIP